MITCPNCGKANQPTRKFCIRCGQSLLKPSARTQKVSSSVPELGTVTTAKTLKAKAEPETAEKSRATTSPTTDDRWVKPSSVSRDRVRTTGRRAESKSESEKAREVFEKAMSYGIDETGTGVVETRMLRASEVRDLLESPVPMEEEVPVTTPPRSEPPPDERDVHSPVARAVKQTSEERILGTHSAFVYSPSEEVTEMPESAGRPPDTAEFTSSRYAIVAEDAEEAPAAPISIEPSAGTADSLQFEDLPSTPTPRPRPLPVTEEHTAVCGSCGAIVHVDDFSYPVEVYSVMGEARLKQARFYVVQGKYEEAKRTISIAKGLFTKAGDDGGLAQVEKLARSLERSG